MVEFIENEYIPPDLAPTITAAAISGMWPPLRRKGFYYILSFVVFFGIGVGCPATQLMNMAFVDSITDVMDQCLISITMIASAWKGFNMFMQSDRIREIFRLHRDMLEHTNKIERERFRILSVNNTRLYYFFIAMYMCGWTGVCFQTIFSSPEKRLWPSTYFLPFEFAKYRAVYLGGLLYQGLSEVLFCIWNALQDTYPIIMILMLYEHVDQLQKRIKKLGNIEVNDGQQTRPLTDVEHFHQLKECCIYYEKCLTYVNFRSPFYGTSKLQFHSISIFIVRFWKLMEDAVSFAYLFQFGASGFVICTSAYQLSIVRLKSNF